MKGSRAPDTPLIGGAVAAAVAAAMAAFAVLSGLSTPPRLEHRIDAVEANIERTRAVFGRPREPSHYLVDPLCHASPSNAADLVRAELTRTASQAGLAAPSVTVAGGSADPANQTYPVMFTVDATDRYDLVLGFLDRLAQSEPEVFADSVDLVSKTSAVSLKLTGRVECLASS